MCRGSRRDREEVRETDTGVSVGPAGVAMLIDTQRTALDKDSETQRERWRDRQGERGEENQHC